MTVFKSPPIHRTPRYRAVAAWQNMNRRCLNRDGKSKSYTDVELRISREEFVLWALPQYEKILAEDPSATPTVSRTVDVGHYEFGNIEIIPWRKHKTLESRLRMATIRPRPDQKFCTKCWTEKEYVHFAKHSGTADGHAYWCRQCVKQYCEANREQQLAMRRERRRAKKNSSGVSQ